MEQEIGLRDLPAGGERPVGADALGLESAAGVRVGDGRVLKPTRADEPPQPRDRRGDKLHHAHDAVVRLVDRGGRHTHAERADVDLLRLAAGDDVVDHGTRDDDAGIRARLAGGLDDVLPDEAGGAGGAVHVEELERFARVDADALIHRAVAVALVAVHAQEPAVLRVRDDEAAGAVLQILVDEDHVVRDRVDLARLAEGDVVILAADRVRAEQNLAVRLAVDLLEHFALAAAGGALVHEHDLVFIRRLEDRGGGVVGDPALVLADVEQDGEHALFRGRAGVEVVGEDLVQRLAALVDDDLLAVEVRQPERRGDVDDRPGRKARLHLVDADEALHIRERQREKRRVRRADHQRVVAVVAAAGVEGEDDVALRLKPLHRLGAEEGEVVAVHVPEAGLVGREVVADAHAVGVAAAHVVLHEVDDGAVLAADDLGLLEKTLAGDVVRHVKLRAVRRAVAKLLELLLRLGIAAPGALRQRLADVVGHIEAVEERVN